MARTGEKRLVYVIPYQGSTIKYGFQTNIDAADGQVLGHANVTTYPAGLVIGANAPKPARATKFKTTGIVSSFVNAGNVASARSQGWKVGRFRYRSGGSTSKAKTVYVTINGIKYAWNMPNTTAQRLGGAQQGLGIRQSASTDKDLVFGASYPKPPQAYRAGTATGGRPTTVVVYYDPSIALPAGWKAIGQGDPTQAQ